MNASTGAGYDGAGGGAGIGATPVEDIGEF